MDYITLIGVLGSGLILVAFIAGQFGKLATDDWRYDLLNLLGSALLTWYAVLLGSYPFIVLNVVWFLVSSKDLLKRLKR